SDECRKCTDCQVALDYLIGTETDDKERSYICNRIDDHEASCRPFRMSGRFIEEITVSLIKTARFRLLHCKTFNDIDALDSLMQISLYFCQRLRTVTRHLAQTAEEIPYPENVKREYEPGHNRQLSVQTEHDCESNQNRGKIQPDVHKAGHYEIFSLLYVIDDTRDDFPYLVIRIILGTQHLQVPVQFFTNII